MRHKLLIALALYVALMCSSLLLPASTQERIGGSRGVTINPTTGTLPKRSSATAYADSLASESGSNFNVNGNLNLTGGSRSLALGSGVSISPVVNKGLKIAEEAASGFSLTLHQGGFSASREYVAPNASGTLALANATATRLPKLSATAGVLSDSLLSDDGTNTTLTSGALRGPDGTAGAPTYSFGNFTNSGMHATSGNLRFSVNGALIGQFTSTGLTLLPSSNAALAFPSGEAIVEAAANTLAIRNGASAQALLVNNTYTDSSNGEWAALQWGSNRFDIFTTKNGTGTQRDIRIRAGTSNGAFLNISSDQTVSMGNGIVPTLWQFGGGSGQSQTNVLQGTLITNNPFLNHTATWNASGVTFTNFLSNVTDTASASGSLLMDLQVGGSSKFQVGKAGGFTAQGTANLYGGVTEFAAGAVVRWAARSTLLSGVDGDVRITNNAQSASGNLIIAKVCYDTGKTVCDFAGAGSPEGAVTASVGSTYRRTDGGAGTTFYVKESGAGNTGWVAK